MNESHIISPTYSHLVIAIKNCTCEISLVRFVVAQFITRLLSERALRATGGRDREIAPTKIFRNNFQSSNRQQVCVNMNLNDYSGLFSKNIW